MEKQMTKPAPERAGAGDLFPMPGFNAMRTELDRLFHALSLPEMNWRAGPGGRADVIGLRVDVAETDTEIEVTSELPGIAESDVDVSLDGDMLRISAEKRSDKDNRDKTWHVVERSYGRFERSIRVPVGIDPEAVTARFKDGVLTVTLPKPAEETPSARKIAISGG